MNYPRRKSMLPLLGITLALIGGLWETIALGRARWRVAPDR